MGDKNNKTERFSAYVVIPSQVFFDMEMSDKAKLLYGLISSMCNHLGYCWAKNSTLARFMGVKQDKSIRDYLSELKKKDYISVEQTNESGTTIRKIYIAALVNLSDRPVNFDRPPGQNLPNRPVNFDRQNNININNIPPIAPQGGGGGAESPKAAVSGGTITKKVRKTSTGEIILSPELEESFVKFWAAYPRHESPQEARKRWGQLNPDNELESKIHEAIKILKRTEQWQRGKAPYASTFLNNRRWEDAEGIAPAPAQPETQQELPGGEWLE